MASGLKIKKSNFKNFKYGLLKFADLKLSNQKPEKCLLIDLKIKFSEINSILIKLKSKLKSTVH